MRSDDWRALRGAGGVFLACLVVSLGLLAASQWFWLDMRVAYESKFGAFREASARYLAIDDEERIIAEEYPRFEQLQRAGVIGAEQRLNWVEALRQADSPPGLPSLDYRIEAQQTHSPGFALPGGSFVAKSSDMHLELALVHEAELLRLLERLEAAKPGLFSVESCALQRVGGAQGRANAEPHLRGECLLRWFTLDLPGLDQPAP